MSRIRLGESSPRSKNVVLRSDVVKYDPGSYAVFFEQGSSVSHTTAAKVFRDCLIAVAKQAMQYQLEPK